MSGTICRRFCSNRIFSQQSTRLHKYTNKVLAPTHQTTLPLRIGQQRRYASARGLMDKLYNRKAVVVCCGALIAPLAGYMWYSVSSAPYTGRKRVLGDVSLKEVLTTYLEWAAWLLHRDWADKNMEMVPTDDPLYAHVATLIKNICKANDLAAIPTEFTIYNNPKDTTSTCSSPGILNFNAAALRSATDEEVERIVARNFAHVVMEHRSEQAFSFLIFTLIGIACLWPLVIRGPGGARTKTQSNQLHTFSLLVPTVTYIYFTKVYWKIMEKESHTVGDIFVKALNEHKEKDGTFVPQTRQEWEDNTEYSF